MHTVTIICKGAEVGFGQGETEEFALEEAYESLDAMGRDMVEEFGCSFVAHWVS